MLNSIVKIWLSVAIALVLLSIGFFLGKYQSFPLYYFKHDLDVVGIATIISNFIIAWYISVLLGRKNDIDKKDKEIILNRLDKIIFNFESFTTQVHSNNIKFIDVTSFIKRTTISIENLFKSFASYHTINHRKKVDDFSTEMQRLNKMMTYTPPQQQTQMSGIVVPIMISNSTITYSEGRIEELFSSNR